MSRLDRTNSVHHVYRCYDGAGRLIYVGSSANLFGRLDQHRHASWWASQVSKVEAQVHPNGTVAREHERHAIRTEQPRWNKSGRWVTRHDWTRDQWDDWLTMLLRRDSYSSELQRFVDLYRRTWGDDPDAASLEAVRLVEADTERRRQEMLQRNAEARDRWAAIEREDELALRREKKAAKEKARRLNRKAKRARRALREFEGVEDA